jgi:hypothetical protein
MPVAAEPEETAAAPDPASVADAPTTETDADGQVAPAEMTDAERAAARWRGRMKSKPSVKEAQKEESVEEAPAEVQSGAEVAEENPQVAPSANGAGSDGDVDVVALAREFSSLFGDEGREA